MAVAGSGVWVAGRPFPSASHRGGTLTVADTSLPTDPAQGVGVFNSVLFTAYDGLTAFRRSGGAAGLTLVPDLGMTLPRPTAGGTMYTFTLRRGIRYSNGNLVRASDFRRGIQRELIIGPAAGIPDYYDGILGAPACQQRPKRCDLSAGIVTDDAAGRITFRLAQADPDFLYTLDHCLARSARYSRPRHQPRAVPARHRPLHDLASPAEPIRYPRAQPVLPPVVIRRAAGGIPGCHPAGGGGQRQRGGIGSNRRPGRPDGTFRRRSVTRRPIPGPGLPRSQNRH